MNPHRRLFSPSAIAALGLADLYAQLTKRLGSGFGAGAIVLSSQDTGSGATANCDEAVTQALVLGSLAGLPFVAVGLLFGRQAIALLGASPAVARLGGTYLAVIFTASSARHMALIGTKPFQGTGDTRTPMVITIAANVLNIAGTLTLGLGLGPAPRLAVVGVGLATALSNAFIAGMVLLAIYSDRTEPSLVRPANPAITKQLIAVSVPMLGEGLSATVVYFPFNACCSFLGPK